MSVVAIINSTMSYHLLQHIYRYSFLLTIQSTCSDPYNGWCGLLSGGSMFGMKIILNSDFSALKRIRLVWWNQIIHFATKCFAEVLVYLKACIAWFIVLCWPKRYLIFFQERELIKVLITIPENSGWRRLFHSYCDISGIER